MARKRKLRRFRLDDSTTLEVSATSDATRTQIRRRGRWSLVVGMLIALAVGAVMASADTVTPDGDTVTAGNQGTVNLGTVTPGAVLTRTTRFTLTCTGKNHPDQGQTLGLVFSSGQSTIPAGSLSANDGSIGPIPAAWPDDTSGGGSTNCPSPDPTLSSGGAGTDSTVTITAPTTPGTYSYVVWWNFSLSPAGSNDTNAVVGNNTSVTYTLTVASPDVAPVIAWTANPSTATTGDTKTYSFSINDSDSSSWSFTSGYPDCGSGTLGSSSIDNGAKTGTFQCTFASAGNPTVSAKVNDGSKDSNLLTQAVVVSPPPDTTAPTVNCIVPDQSVWYGSNVTVNCTASDSGSGLATPSDASFSLSTSVASGNETASASTGSHQVCDNASNCTTAGPYVFMVDRKAPQLSGCDTEDGQWHANNVTLNCTYTDGGSGPASQQVALTTSVASGSEDANAAASAGGAQACDAVGNCASSPADIGGNMIDRKVPSYTCDTAPTTWSAADVTINCTATDGGSGLTPSTDSSFTLSTNVAADTETSNASTGTKTLTDAVGNSVVASPITGLKVDKKAPTYSCDPAPTAWSATDITINCTAIDGGSGLTPSTDSSFTLSTNVAADTETSNASTGTKTLTDAVGNSATAGPLTGLKVDKKAPTIALVSRTQANGAGWNNTSVELVWSCADGGSGVVSDNDSKTVSTEGAGQSATGTCTDNVGHTATDTVTGINIDETAPSITFSGQNPAKNSYGWNNSTVTLSWTCSDTLSGIPTGGLSVTQPISTEGSGQQATGTCYDKAGNSNSSTDGNVNIDKTPPTVAVTGVTNGATYPLGSVPTAGCSTTDDRSGVQTNATVSTTGGPVGNLTATCSGGKDKADNGQSPTSVSVTYTVVYVWTGFFQPVDNLPNWNSAKAGSAVPVKFNLGGNQGTNIFPSGYPKVTQIACPSSGTITDPIETYTTTAGGSTLTYDTTAMQYIYAWKTDKAWAGLCFSFQLGLNDGTTHNFNVQFTK